MALVETRVWKMFLKNFQLEELASALLANILKRMMASCKEFQTAWKKSIQ